MTKQLTVKIKRQNKFEFIANNKVCIEEEVPVNQSDIATEILSKRKNEQTGEESESGRLISFNDSFTYSMTGRNLDVPLAELQEQYRQSQRQQTIDRQDILTQRQRELVDRQNFLNAHESVIDRQARRLADTIDRQILSTILGSRQG